MNKGISTIIFLVLAAALLAAVACGSSSTASPPSQSLPTQSLPTVTPIKGDPPPAEPAPVEVPAPIEDAALVFPTDPNGVYSLVVTSGLPSGCAKFDGYEVTQIGNEFVVEVTNLVSAPSEPIACTAIYGYHDEMIELDGIFVSGETYDLIINGEPMVSFTVN